MGEDWTAETAGAAVQQCHLLSCIAAAPLCIQRDSRVPIGTRLF